MDCSYASVACSSDGPLPMTGLQLGLLVVLGLVAIALGLFARYRATR